MRIHQLLVMFLLCLGVSSSLLSQNFTQVNSWITRLTSGLDNQVRLEFYDLDGTRHGAITGQSDGVNFGLIDGDGQWSLLAQKDQFTQFRVNNKIRMRIGKEAANTTLLSLGDFNNTSGNAMTFDVAAGHGHSNILTGAFLNGSGKHKFIGTRKASRLVIGDGAFHFKVSTNTPVRGTEVTWRDALSVTTDNGYVKLHQRVLQLGNQQFWGNNTSQFYFRSNHKNSNRIILFSDDNANTGNAPVNVNLGAFFGNRNATTGQKAMGILDGDGNWSYQAVQDLATIFRIDNSEKMRITLEGNVGIGTNAPSQKLHVSGAVRSNEIYVNTNSKGSLPASYKMFVNGAIAAEEVRCQLNQNWGDYVFAADYDLMPLDELKSYLHQNSHLPNIPAAAVIESEGLEMADMVTRQMVKIEELTLYTIEQEEAISKLQAENKALQQLLIELNKRLTQLETEQ